MSDTMYTRPSWNEYFLNIMKKVGSRSTCARARIAGGGCVIVRDKHILVTGYVGSPSGIEHCDDAGHEFKKMIHEDNTITEHCLRATHAEQNAICQAAKLGISIDKGTLYCFMTPCYTCAKIIITSGIKKVIAFKDYHVSKDSKRIFQQAKIDFKIIYNEIPKYDS